MNLEQLKKTVLGLKELLATKYYVFESESFKVVFNGNQRVEAVYISGVANKELTDLLNKGLRDCENSILSHLQEGVWRK
ncbi:hypothetical protein NG798_20220 [Ancylothrix sp. C2]|nr:hypothetical protein [Ancylothrix sp. D3o]